MDTSRPLLRIFVTGLLAALPLVATVAIVVWVGSLVWQGFGPDSAVGRVLVSVGVGVTGSVLIGYLFGLALLVGALFGLGLLVEAGLERGLALLVDSIVKRIPIVRGLYDMIRRIVVLFAQRDEEGLKSMRPVWCTFGGAGGAAVLALLSTPQTLLLGDRRYLCVLVPTAPVPIGGGLLYVPEEWVTPAEIGIEGVTSLYVSMGVTSAQYLPTVQPPPGRPQGD
jgi:uncharacterized membrane protein